MAELPKKLTRKQLVAEAMRIVYPDVASLAAAQAMEHTIVNLGASLEDFFMPHARLLPERLLSSAWAQFRECYGAEMGDEGEGIEEERRSWEKDSLVDAQRVAVAGLPLTLENCRLAFEHKGPFVVGRRS